MAVRRDTDGEFTPVWERPEPPSRPAPSPLSRDRIVEAAIRLADADGLDAVSLRKVAAALDAGPMRLYGYLSTKTELLDLMADAVYGEIAPPAPDGDWRAALRSLAHGLREAALRHEWFADLLGGRPPLGPCALAYLEATLAALDGAPGFDDVDAVTQAAHTVNAYVIGAVRSEIAESRTERATGLDERRWQAANGPYLDRLLATGRYPALAKMVGGGPHPDAETAFATGLDQVLAGITAR
ncbi:TetR/AcrR family transcriptional regulator C-terminal domain-containing protein [Actinoallomurus soli]|uniref:TetR/AcrR family transcriptional regulator C-terminal domain-containing protein n=1 Tax=Actinoallomurus soli TaxID=2952535 RepID=UPI002093E624|nr:TetR/AcrR family transcriptional regulator C-terminal domain-containing protein [Actinoallomurus soli]MCO5971198.1 TetR/AcrR family transcriptional regulator [Actinoallomurus soli]